jgi:hypothetical protein
MEDNGVKIVSEPVLAYSGASYADVMEYIHSLHISHADKERVAKRLALEVSQPALSAAYERIDHLCSLKNNWDGRGALAISPKIIKNIKSVLLISDNADWEHWMIAPDTNATIGLESDTTGAVISLGAYEYSYFARIDGVRHGESHIQFSPESLLELMRKFG